MLKNHKPLVSLGIPVYNESAFLEKTINSLINQSYPHIEIIAIDNNSKDSSFNILKKVSKKDKRIKIYKNDENIGMSNNFNLVYKKSTGKYFAWIGAHDIYEENFVENLVSQLSKTKNAAVAFVNISKIDSNGKKFGGVKDTGFDLSGNNSILRLIKLPWIIKGSGDIVMGLFNKKTLNKTTLFSNSMLWSDVFLIYQIARLGKIIKVNENLRYRRFFREDEKKFNNWEEKYNKITSRFRSNDQIGENKIKISFYFPVILFCWKLFIEIGIKKIYNPINLILSVYLITLFSITRRKAILIDFKNFFKKFKV
jgi:glycosyltransferase involved in cell wall biosynthesis